MQKDNHIYLSAKKDGITVFFRTVPEFHKDLYDSLLERQYEIVKIPPHKWKIQKIGASHPDFKERVAEFDVEYLDDIETHLNMLDIPKPDWITKY